MFWIWRQNIKSLVTRLIWFFRNSKHWRSMHVKDWALWEYNIILIIFLQNTICKNHLWKTQILLTLYHRQNSFLATQFRPIIIGSFEKFIAWFGPGFQTVVFRLWAVVFAWWTVGSTLSHAIWSSFSLNWKLKTWVCLTYFLNNFLNLCLRIQMFWFELPHLIFFVVLGKSDQNRIGLVYCHLILFNSFFYIANLISFDIKKF